MAEGSQTIRYVLIAFFLIGIAFLSIPYVLDFLKTTDYGFTVDFVDENTAKSGEVVHLTDEDIAQYPKLGQALLDGSYGGDRLTEQESHTYGTRFPNYVDNVTVKRAYYEYGGRYFYLWYNRDDVRHL
ncbi:MAG TPA: hypothetical protein VMB35_04295 [Methanomicrobiales archaeon]|nr:hypothetical protein [Methanomicrobiales archaeon]